MRFLNVFGTDLNSFCNKCEDAIAKMKLGLNTVVNVIFLKYGGTIRTYLLWRIQEHNLHCESVCLDVYTNLI